MEALWQTNFNLAEAARWPGVLGSRQTRTRVTELAILIALGVVAAIATTVAPGGLRIPGHAILRGTFPLILGISLVPRRSAGTTMSLAAAAAFLVLRIGGLGLPNPASGVGLLALGPAADVALAGATGGWVLYLRLAAAGLIANLIAFGVRIATSPLLAHVPGSGQGGGGGRGMGGGNGMGMGKGNGMGGGRGLGAGAVQDFWPTALVSFALCGAIAGLLCAMLWFRAAPRSTRQNSP